ncbi:MAG: sodium:calcium antiporter [Bacteroidales bacterium]|nr:sodium:calcium antiporter [Bacteroidales bacterium]
MWHDILFLLIGLGLLVAGANYVTDGAVAVAKRFKVSNLIIGLTVVALGSTLPDMVVCVESAFHGESAMPVGEVIGSNTFDLLLVVGVMGLVRPLKVSAELRYQDLPILLISSVALWVAGDTVLFDSTTHNIVNRTAGIMLIMIFVFYMWFMILNSRRERPLSAPEPTDNKPAGDVAESAVSEKLSCLKQEQWFSWVMIAAGLVALVVGGNWVVDGASGLALKVGMSQGLVALTVVAIGNALPDLVTSLTAAIKGASGIALGNIVGSCVINALLSVGLSATVVPLKADSIGFVDFITLVGASALIWLVPLLSKNKSIGRIFGSLLVLLYIAYMTFTIIRG